MEVSAFGSPVKKALTGSFDENVKAVQDSLHIPDNEDALSREFQIAGKKAQLFYIDGMADDSKMQRFILGPAMQLKAPPEGESFKDMLTASLPASSVSATMQLSTLLSRVLSGDAALLADGLEGALIFDVKGYEHRSVQQPINESVVIGPQEGFNESLRDNVVLMRRIMHSPALVSEQTSVGTHIPVKVCLLYLSGVAEKTIVDRIKYRLQKCEVDYVLSAGMLEQLLEDRPYSLLPQVAMTERPDRAASFLIEGQVLLFLENAPCALAMPVNILNLYHAPDDTSMRWQYGTFLRILRLIGILTSLFLPALFVSLSMHHAEGMSLALVTSIVESQASVPLSLFSSMLLMLVVFSLINEASTRVPGAMGSSLSIVGGLILGTAAVQADIVSPLVIIVVAIAGIGSYAVPDYPLTIALRIMQLILVLAAGVMGYLGVALISFFFLLRLMTLTSCGAPYFAPYSPQRTANPDKILRLPIWRQRLRGYLAAPENMLRSRRRMRGWEEDEKNG